jgi:hypothetical protein
LFCREDVVPDLQPTRLAVGSSVPKAPNPNREFFFVVFVFPSWSSCLTKLSHWVAASGRVVQQKLIADR